METYGIPLEVIIEVFEQRGLVIDWIDFLDRSQKCGWSFRTTLSKIEVALLDTKGREYTDNVLLRLKFFIGQSTKFENK